GSVEIELRLGHRRGQTLTRPTQLVQPGRVVASADRREDGRAPHRVARLQEASSPVRPDRRGDGGDVTTDAKREIGLGGGDGPAAVTHGAGRTGGGDPLDPYRGNRPAVALSAPTGGQEDREADELHGEPPETSGTCGAPRREGADPHSRNRAGQATRV